MRIFQTLKLSQFHKAKTCWTENWWSIGILSNFLASALKSCMDKVKKKIFDAWKKTMNFKHELSPSKFLLRSTLSLILGLSVS